MTEPVVQRGRGVLDTNIVIMLPRVTTSALLPAEPLITAVTLAELSVGAAGRVHRRRNEPRARPTSNRPRPISTRCRLTRRLRGPSVEWPPRCVARVGR